MRIMKAYELLAHLRCLQLVGQDSEGNLEWIGTNWDMVDKEMECILRDYYEQKNETRF